MLATPYLLLAAIAPAAFALVVERYGYGAGEAILLGAGALSLRGDGSDGALVPAAKR